jgi:hypothetical protein
MRGASNVGAGLGLLEARTGTTMLLEMLVKAKLNIRKRDTNLGPYSSFNIRFLFIFFLLEILLYRETNTMALSVR